ncbi:ATP-dependent helicase BRM [Trifolium repens]|nr:ATP-dependent helicase BRM [Trifolium repens]
MNSHIAVAAELQAMQAWAREKNIDLSHPTNANLMAKLIPMMQSRMVIKPPKATESNIGAHSSPVPVSKQQVNSPAVVSESSAHANSSSDVSGQSGSSKAGHTVPPGHLGSATNAGHSSDMAMQQINVHGRESQAPLRQQVKPGNGMPSMHSQQSSAAMNLGATDHPLNAKGGSGNYAKSQGAPAQIPERQSAFVKQQLHVLKAHILAFRWIKKGEGTLPQELLQAITPPPLEIQAKQPNHPAGGQSQVKSAGNIVAEQLRHAEASANKSQSISAVNGHSSVKQESFSRYDKSAPPPVHTQAVMPSISKESAGKEEHRKGVK